MAVLVLVFSISLTAAAYEREAVMVDTPPVIDGTLDDIWGISAPFALNDYTWKYAGGTSIARLSGWAEGKDPLARWARVHILWDEDNLYVGARISDGILEFKATQGSPLNGQDTLQVTLDPKMSCKADVSEGFIFDFSVPTSMETGPALWYEHWQYGDAPASLGLEAACSVDESGWTVEAAIPWSALKGWIKPEVGARLGFGLLLLDFDKTGGPTELITDFGNGQNTIGSASSWNTLVLVD